MLAHSGYDRHIVELQAVIELAGIITSVTVKLISLTFGPMVEDFELPKL